MKLALGKPVWLELNLQPAALWRSLLAPKAKPNATPSRPVGIPPPSGAVPRHRARAFLDLP